MHLYRASVWAPNGVPEKDWRFRNIFRVVLPVTDLLFLYFGVVGWTNGIGSVEAAAGSSWQTGWSAMIVVFAFMALVGISFPKLWAVELAGKLFLIGLVAVYIAVFFSRIITEPTTAATAGLIVILILLPTWRATDLGVVASNAIRRRRR